MKIEDVKAMFQLAGIPVTGFWKLENGYWPEHENYDKLRKENPWWLLKTPAGLIRIGMRKRVLEINWSETAIRQKITDDPNVTSEDTYVHAWSDEDALKHLKALGKIIKDAIPVRPSRLTGNDENLLKDMLVAVGKQPALLAVLAAEWRMDGPAMDAWLDGLFIKLGNGRVTVESHG